jgi:hypothetical protein
MTEIKIESEQCVSVRKNRVHVREQVLTVNRGVQKFLNNETNSVILGTDIVIRTGTFGTEIRNILIQNTVTIRSTFT